MRVARTVWYSVLLTASLILPEFAQAQIPILPDCGRWITVSAWQGTVTLSGNGQVAGPDGAIYKINETISGTIRFDTPPVFCGNQINWASAQDQPVITASINDEKDTPDNNCNPPGYIVSKVSVTGGKAKDTFAALLIDVQHGTYRISFTGDIQDVQSTSTTCGMTPTVTTGDDSTWGANQGDGIYLMNPFKLPDSGFTLSGTQTYQGQANLFGINPSVLFGWTATWNLTPAVDQLEVVIDPQGYDTWRPQAAMDESTPANTIAIQATLQYTSGKPVNTGAQKFIFQLANVSAEPGITMNFPVKAARPANLDLQFTPESNPTLSTSTQRAETLQADLTQATATVTSFDWGAWGEIQVTAIMPDGTQIQGHLRNNDSAISVLLPKRSADSHIADVWKQAHNVAGQSDDDDSETDPVGLDGCIGDGLTLYEEYRGFIENGKHIEGDPQHKDFFIQNLVGADAEPGIWLFTDLTGLDVHKDLQANEMGSGVVTTEFHGIVNTDLTGTVPINSNYAAGAHQVDQHGVVLAPCKGGIQRQADIVRGRPGATYGICAIAQTAGNEGQAADVSPKIVGAFLAHDRSIARELLRSVGVPSHGDGDKVDFFFLLAPDDPKNHTGEPLLIDSSGANLRVLTEAGDDLASLLWEGTLYKNLRTFCRVVTAASFLFPNGWVDICQLILTGGGAPSVFRLGVLIGEPRAEHSGNDQCIMRNAWAAVYPATSAFDTYYLSLPYGSEPFGFSLCNSPAGTGVNAPDHKPQPRYYDAAPGRGACQQLVCVSDKYPAF